MSDLHRAGAGMAALESKQRDNNSTSNNGEYWNDVNNQLSPVRKHLINTYLQVQDEEALPLLGEYFGVALSFMALGALVRASNSTKKRRKSVSEEDRLDLRACSRFQRMALESMLREAMERLRGLAQTAYQMEERVNEMVEAEVEKDKEKVALLSRLADAEKAVQELKALRKAEGRANERVMSIVAAKEQDWLKEKRSLQKEIQRLKDNLSTVCREVKFLSRRCRSPTCEHCKGIERVVGNVRGRVSLRELNYRETSAHVSARREVVKVMEQPSEVDEVEAERVLIKAMEHKKKKNVLPGHLQIQTKVEKHVEWTGTSSSVNPTGGSAGGAGQSMNKELIAKQQQDMESELANILKRVGMLKQRSHSSAATAPEQLSTHFKSEIVSTSPESLMSLESKKYTSEEAEAASLYSDRIVSELLKDSREAKKPSSGFGSDEIELLELDEDLTTGLLTLEQEALLSAVEDPDLLELEKAFEYDADTVTANLSPEVLNALGGDALQEANISAEGNLGMTSEEARMFYEDTEIAEFESYLTLDLEALSLAESGGGLDTMKDSDGEQDIVLTPKEVSLVADAENAKVMETVVQAVQTSCEESAIIVEEDDHYVLDVTRDYVVNVRSSNGLSDDVREEGLEGTVIDMKLPAGNVDQVNPENLEEQDILCEVENVEQTCSADDAGTPTEPSPSGDLIGLQDGLQNSTDDYSSPREQIPLADSTGVEDVSSTISKKILDDDDDDDEEESGAGNEILIVPDTRSHDIDEETVAVRECELESGKSGSLVDGDKSFAVDVKAVDDGESSESEQVLEMVQLEDSAAAPERHIPPLESQNGTDSENVDKSAAGADLFEQDKDDVTTAGKRNSEAEIPVFERASSEDLAGELPEPDEKRVCDSGESELSAASDADSADKFSDESPSEPGEAVENLKVDDSVVDEDGELPLQLDGVDDQLKKLRTASSEVQSEVNTAVPGE